ncbi:MAG: heavy metal-binding domain-containing protein [Myxococcales bacterium]|nr:heavy metal-binding domain-containing protein [Myxococcales bacterium]
MRGSTRSGRIRADARSRGANGIIGVRDDTTAVGANVSEVLAYGTAVWADVRERQEVQEAPPRSSAVKPARAKPATTRAQRSSR